MSEHPDLQRDVTYGELVVQALERFPERIAFRQGDLELTYRATADLLARWVSVLRKLWLSSITTRL